MKIDAPLRDIPLGEVGAEAARYERLGFDGLRSFETRSDPFLSLLPAALSTRHMSVGTNIAVAFARSPFATAMLAWDLQKASHGRLILGLGTQVRAHVERRFSAAFEHPAARVTEFIDCTRAIWRTFQDAERPAFKGRFYNFTLINDFFNPGPIEHPEIPVWLAGVNERMCRAAGETADGFHLHPMNSPAYIREVVRPALAAGAALRGRDASGIQLHAPVFVVFGETEAERARMERSVRQQVGFYASTPSYRSFLAHHGFEQVGRTLSELMRAGELGKMPGVVPDALLDTVAISGRFHELPAALRARYGDGLVDRASLYTAVPADADEAAWSRFTLEARSARN
jgi:probable F420-dependent oxidoreductase